ncbi:MAG: class I SAM-dependent methyltransferase [Deltaproteobacteria bacterium]|jgi:demethylmenaquinone methyltransferase/2-methoxy-6-polyprenyl-1,4-benzoquinol methylase|nr:class I SAM-dependent methyltransferase [Deltaproteobacteria bacterium]
MDTPAKIKAFEEAIRTMFEEISPRYDLLNLVLTLGRDNFWRDALSRRLLALDPYGEFLDLATGTGRQLISIAKYHPKAKLVGLDFSAPMLKVAEDLIKKTSQANSGDRQPVLILGDAMNPGLGHNRFDSVSISFGLRNIADRRYFYHQVYDTLKPGGRFLILELFFDPRPWWSGLYKRLLLTAVPYLASVVFGSSHSAYSYLGRSIVNFPDPGRLIDELSEAGFTEMGFRVYTFGAVMLLWAHKPVA